MSRIDDTWAMTIGTQTGYTLRDIADGHLFVGFSYGLNMCTNDKSLWDLQFHLPNQFDISAYNGSTEGAICIDIDKVTFGDPWVEMAAVRYGMLVAAKQMKEKYGWRRVYVRYDRDGGWRPSFRDDTQTTSTDGPDKTFESLQNEFSYLNIEVVKTALPKYQTYDELIEKLEKFEAEVFA